jgi:hypothetical protein
MNPGAVKQYPKTPKDQLTFAYFISCTFFEEAVRVKVLVVAH